MEAQRKVEEILERRTEQRGEGAKAEPMGRTTMQQGAMEAPGHASRDEPQNISGGTEQMGMGMGPTGGEEMEDELSPDVVEVEPREHPTEEF